jgi:hypothetical protein
MRKHQTVLLITAILITTSCTCGRNTPTGATTGIAISRKLQQTSPQSGPTLAPNTNLTLQLSYDTAKKEVTYCIKNNSNDTIENVDFNYSNSSNTPTPKQATLGKAAQKKITIKEAILPKGATKPQTLTLDFKGASSTTFKFQILEKNKIVYETIGTYTITEEQDTKTLYDALRNNEWEKVKDILAGNISPDMLNFNDSKEHLIPTPLCVATFYGKKEVIEQLIQKGAKIDDKVLEVAWDRCNDPITELLLKQGAQDKESNVLAWAISHKNINLAVAAIKSGSNINAHLKHQNNATPLHLAAQGDDEEMVKLLLDNGARTDLKDGSNQTALDTAISQKIKKLIKDHTTKG